MSDRILQKLADEHPELRALFAAVCGRAPRFRYFQHKAKGFQERWHIWTVERDGSGRYVSGVYHKTGDTMKLRHQRKHKRRAAAKARALRLHNERARAVRQAQGYTPCARCDGTGAVDGGAQVCPACHGKGEAKP